MRPDRQARARVVGEEPLGHGHRASMARPAVATARPGGRRAWTLAARPSARRILEPRLLEEFAGGSNGLLDLPERRAPIEAEGIERADLGERGHLVAAQAGAADELVEGGETRTRE